MKKTLFEIAILLHPTEKQIKEGISTELIRGPLTILASNQRQAEMQVIMGLEPDYKDKLDQIVIACRPF